MRRLLPFALVLAVGAALGWMARTPDPRARRAAPPAAPFTGPISARQVDGPQLYLRPHAVTVDGRTEVLAPIPPGAPVWILTLDNGRVNIGCTEERPEVPT